MTNKLENEPNRISRNENISKSKIPMDVIRHDKNKNK